MAMVYRDFKPSTNIITVKLAGDKCTFSCILQALLLCYFDLHLVCDRFHVLVQVPLFNHDRKFINIDFEQPTY